MVANNRISKYFRGKKKQEEEPQEELVAWNITLLLLLDKYFLINMSHSTLSEAFSFWYQIMSTKFTMFICRLKRFGFWSDENACYM